MRDVRKYWLCALALLCGAVATGGEPRQFQAYALIVAGEGSEPNFTENYRDWTVRLHKTLTADCGIPAGNVRVLMEKKELAPEIVTAISMKENVFKTFKDLKSKVKRGDQILLVYIGHGTAQNKIGKLCLPGPDITSDETAELLAQLPNREVVFINSACCSDSFVNKCSLPGRAVIAATNNSGEGNETYFMEFLLRAYENRARNSGDMTGFPAVREIGIVSPEFRVNLLEAFNDAATACPKWYLRQYLEDKVGWRIEGKQSRQLWQKFYGSVKDKTMADALDADADDAEPQLGEWGPHWQSRRMPAEHAQLDDNGDHQGTAVFAGNQFTPLAGGEEGVDGWYARKIVLGKPQGNTEPPPVPIEGIEKDR